MKRIPYQSIYSVQVLFLVRIFSGRYTLFWKGTLMKVSKWSNFQILYSWQYHIFIRSFDHLLLLRIPGFGYDLQWLIMGTVLIPTASKEWPRTNVVFFKFTSHEQPLPWKLRLQIILLSVGEFIKNGYFTVRVTVRGVGGSAPLVLTISKCDHFECYFIIGLQDRYGIGDSIGGAQVKVVLEPQDMLTDLIRVLAFA